MLPKQHFLYGLILTLILFPFFSWKSLIALAATLLVDVDHYFWYIYQTRMKDFSLKKAYNACKKNKKSLMMVFHTVELWAVLFVASFYSLYSLLVFLGVMFHILLDIFNKERKKYSLIWYILEK